jgi:hypothetical protein
MDMDKESVRVFLGACVHQMDILIARHCRHTLLCRGVAILLLLYPAALLVQLIFGGEPRFPIPILRMIGNSLSLSECM